MLLVLLYAVATPVGITVGMAVADIAHGVIPGFFHSSCLHSKLTFFLSRYDVSCCRFFHICGFQRDASNGTCSRQVEQQKVNCRKTCLHSIWVWTYGSCFHSAVTLWTEHYLVRSNQLEM